MKPCTCIGVCAGVAGLGDRWECVLEAPQADGRERNATSSTANHPEILPPAVQADAARFRKLMDLAVYGGTYKGEHVWRFRPIMGPHANLLDAVDAMGTDTLTPHAD